MSCTHTRHLYLYICNLLMCLNLKTKLITLQYSVKCLGRERKHHPKTFSLSQKTTSVIRIFSSSIKFFDKYIVSLWLNVLARNALHLFSACNFERASTPSRIVGSLSFCRAFNLCKILCLDRLNPSYYRRSYAFRFAF